MNNVHATAIVIGTTGVLFFGSSGSGKSRMAFECLNEAKQKNIYSALVSDDQVFINVHQGQIVAEAPTVNIGKLELRHTGIVSCQNIKQAVIHIAVELVDENKSLRMPDNKATYSVAGSISLPKLFIVPKRYNQPLSVIQSCLLDQNKSFNW